MGTGIYPSGAEERGFPYPYYVAPEQLKDLLPTERAVDYFYTAEDRLLDKYVAMLQRALSGENVEVIRDPNNSLWRTMSVRLDEENAEEVRLGEVLAEAIEETNHEWVNEVIDWMKSDGYDWSDDEGDD